LGAGRRDIGYQRSDIREQEKGFHAEFEDGAEVTEEREAGALARVNQEHGEE
jgi:hypothetical protein